MQTTHIDHPPGQQALPVDVVAAAATVITLGSQRAQSPEWVESLKDITAGVLGGCSGIAVGQPLDTIRVRLQTSQHLYKNALDCCLKTVRHEGPLALFRGLAPPLVGNAPLNGIVFGAYGSAQRFWDRHIGANNTGFGSIDRSKPENAHWPNFGKLYVCGVVSGIAQLSVTTPVELIKCKLQSQTPDTPNPYKGSWDCMSRVYRAHGLPGLFRGNVAAFWRDAPITGAYFCTYEAVKYGLSEDPGNPTMLSKLVGGGLAGIVCWLPTYPFDVIKSQIQVLPEGTSYDEARLSNQMRHWYRREGWRFFVRGLGPTLVRAVPVNAATLYIYEESLALLHRPEFDFNFDGW